MNRFRALAWLTVGLFCSSAFGQELPTAKVPGLTATGEYQLFRRVRIHVAAPLELSGSEVKVRSGRHVLGKARLVGLPASSEADLTLPMPPRGRGYSALTVKAGRISAPLALPDLEVERRDLRDESPILFSPAVFSGDEFPTGDFANPSLIEDAFGPYSLKISFYDADYNLVTKPEKPGRYGAVVEVSTAYEGTFKKFATLYKQSGAIDWSAREPLFTGELPPKMGVDPGVLAERAGIWSRLLMNDFTLGFKSNPSSARLLAGLHETKPGDGQASWNNSYHRDETWWYGLKKKIGEVKPVRYLLDLPDGYAADPNKKWPLLLFLHGSGETGDDLSLLRRHGPPKLIAQGQKLPFFVLSPQAPDNYLLGTQLIELLDQISAQYRVDSDRIYLTGLSSGGYSTWFTALEFPERFAAIIPIAAGGDPAGAARLKNLPTWYFVGGKDRNVLADDSQKMVEAMTAAGVPFRFTLYPDAGHGQTWEKAYADPALYEWMLAQKRSP